MSQDPAARPAIPPCRARSRRSSASSARARSCAWATKAPRCGWRRSRRARSRSTSRSASAACRAGRIVEVFGPESSGKTTLVYHVIAEAQKLGGVCAFIDAEHAMDPLYAQNLGVNIDELLVSQPDYGEQGARDRRHARALRRGRRRRDRLRGGAHAAGGARGPDGRPDGRRPGADDEPGDAQARRQPEPDEHALPVREPDPREGRRDVRLAGDAAGRPRAEVLLVPAARHPPHRDAEGGHGGRRQPGPRQGRQEQGRGAVPPGGVRHRVRQGHLVLGLHPRPRRSSTTS